MDALESRDASREIAWALEDIVREVSEVKERLGILEQHLETIHPRPAAPTPRTSPGARSRPRPSKDKLVCSFCGKDQRSVRKLVAGPGVYICDECTELVVEILEEELTAESGSAVSAIEAAALLGVSRQRVYQLAAERPDFPQPAERSPARWHRADIDAWKARSD